MTKSKVGTYFIFPALILGIIVCMICNLAVSSNLNWSLYPIASTVYTGLIIAPFFYLKKKGIVMSILSFSIFTIPFLFCLERITGMDWLLSLGLPNAVILIAYLWAVYGVFAIKKLRWWYASALSLMLAIPFCFLVNFTMSKAIIEPLFDVWDILSYGIIAIVSFALFCTGKLKKRKKVSDY